MARKLFEKQAIRKRSGGLANGVAMKVYTDAAGTALADVSATSGGSAIAGSQVTTANIAGLGPASLRFWGPTDGTDTLYLRTPGDTSLGVQKIESDPDERLDVLEAAGGGDVGVHSADTTAIHGIADTAQLALRNAANTFTGDQTFTSGRPWYDVGGMNTAQVQAVIDAAPARSIIYFSADATLGRITLKDNLTCMGPGMDAVTLTLAASTNLPLFQGDDLSNVEIRDLTLDVNRAAQASGGDGVLLGGCDNAAVRRLRIKNTYYRGIYLFTCTDTIVEGCTITDVGVGPGGTFEVFCGIRAQNGARIRIIGNLIDNVRDGPILADGCTDVTISGNTVRDAETATGIGCNASSRVSIANNTIDDTIEASIDIGTATDVAIVGNTCANGGSGIVGDGASRVAVIGNTIWTTTQADVGNIGAGIAFVAPSVKRGISIVGNTVHLAAADGIFLDSISDSVITANVVTDSSVVVTGGHGIRLAATSAACQNILISGNRCHDTRGTKRQAYGLSIAGATSGAARIIGNDFTGNLTGAINDAGGVASFQFGNTGVGGANLASSDIGILSGSGFGWLRFLDTVGNVYARLVGDTNGALYLDYNVIDTGGDVIWRASSLATERLRLLAGGPLEFPELAADPAAPAANKVRFYCKDNGSGKTGLYARFATGPVQQMALEP